MTPSDAELADLARLRRVAELYAQGADRKDKAAWAAVLASDCVMMGPGFRTEGRDAILGLIDTLGQMFRATLHQVHQVTATISGDTAWGETYCIAEHLLNDADAVLAWAIRYQDEWRREDGTWRFTRRELIVEWEETRPVTPKGAAATGEEQA